MQDCTFKPKINPKTPKNDISFRRRDTLQLNDSPITLLSASPPPPPKRTNIIDVISKPLLLQTSYISSQAQNVVLPLRKKEENK